MGLIFAVLPTCRAWRAILEPQHIELELPVEITSQQWDCLLGLQLPVRGVRCSKADIGDTGTSAIGDRCPSLPQQGTLPKPTASATVLNHAAWGLATVLMLRCLRSRPAGTLHLQWLLGSSLWHQCCCDVQDIPLPVDAREATCNVPPL